MMYRWCGIVTVMGVFYNSTSCIYILEKYKPHNMFFTNLGSNSSNALPYQVGLTREPTRPAYGAESAVVYVNVRAPPSPESDNIPQRNGLDPRKSANVVHCPPIAIRGRWHDMLPVSNSSWLFPIISV
ncbi:hypothetical protein Pelo_1115 [Pelomyxa schiedti]|nr:hypothetical protein Pelo_1115 [Pelomyxa schiedti]